VCLVYKNISRENVECLLYHYMSVYVNISNSKRKKMSWACTAPICLRSCMRRQDLISSGWLPLLILLILSPFRQSCDLLINFVPLACVTLNDCVLHITCMADVCCYTSVVWKEDDRQEDKTYIIAVSCILSFSLGRLVWRKHTHTKSLTCTHSGE